MNEEVIRDTINNRLAYEDIDEFDLALICDTLHCDPLYFVDGEMRNRDLLVLTMNKGTDTVKSKNAKTKIQDFMNDYAFVNGVLLEEA